MWPSTNLRQCAVALLASSSWFTAVAAGHANATVKVLPASFTPPSAFENTNLVRNINLEKAYVREVLNVDLKNVGKEAQTEYYLEFPSDVISKIGGLVVRDREKPEDQLLETQLAKYESPRCVVA